MAMGKRQKETEALIMERNRELEALARRVNELEATIASYREREESIVEAITSAIDTKSAMIKDATTQSKQIVDEANVKAGQIRSKAKLAASQLKEESEKILEKSRREAAQIVESAQKEAKRRLDEANAKADECENSYAQVSAGLADMAYKLNDFISTVRETFDTVQTVEGKGTQALIRPNITPELPEDYKTPSELYHSIMNLQGRTAPANENKKPANTPKKNNRYSKQRPNDPRSNPSAPAAAVVPVEHEPPEEQLEPQVSFKTLKNKLLTTDDITQSIMGITTLGDRAENEKLEAIVREVMPD